MGSKLKMGFSMLLAAMLVACASPSEYLAIETTPKSNFQEIHVDKAYDFVYLAVFDTVNHLDGWEPDQTIKDDGLIRLKNIRSERLDDSSLRVVNIRIRRDSPLQTSVFLDTDSNRVIGSDEILAAIRKKLGVTPA